MEDQQTDIPAPVRRSDQKILRQASFSFILVIALAVVAASAYMIGSRGQNTTVLGTEIAVTPEPSPTTEPIPTLIPATPTSTPKVIPSASPSPTPKLLKINPNLKTLQAIPSSTPTPTPKLLKIQAPLLKTIPQQ